MTDHETRLRLLVEAGIALSSELSLDAVLQRLVEAAAAITGARYAALGVLDRSGRGLEQLSTTGISQEVIDEIGDLPVGRGILGVVITEAKPLRLHDLSEHPRSVGFPPGHPPMRTFLGVPVALRGTAYGNLYLTEKDGGRDFTEEDEELVQLLAAQAAVAIENARLYGSARRWLRQLESLTEVGNAIASETDLRTLLELIAGRLRELIGARLVFIALPAGPGTLRLEASAHDGTGGLGAELSMSDSKSGRVLERRRTERVDSLVDDVEFDRETMRHLCERIRVPVPSAGIFVPLLARGRAIGVVAIHDKLRDDEHDLRFTDEDVRLAEWFARRAAVTVDLSQRIQRDALRRVVSAQELERKRLARELHDETGQALTSILLGLRALEEAPPEAVGPSVEALREIAAQTLRDVRRLAVELRPSALDDFGLVPAVERLAAGVSEQAGIAVQVEGRIHERLPADLETAFYRIAQEALTNVVKHADATNVSILLTREGANAMAVIEDDGRGFRPDATSSEQLGLLGMRERLALLDGTLEVESSPGAGTTIVARARAS